MALTKKAAPYDQNLMRDMKIAQERHGVSLGKQLADFMALRNAGSGLTFEEYLYFGLYGRPRQEFGAYMGDHRARAAFLLANKLTSWDAAEDKLYFAALVAGANLPSPKLLAVAHLSRDSAGARALRSTNDIWDFLKTCALPVFGKPVAASHGDGAVKIVARDNDDLITDKDERFSIEDIAAEINGYLESRGYLFQEALDPHPEIMALTNGRLATVRVMVLLGPEGVRLHSGVVRLPAGENRVDNFRRAGNLIASVDMETGALGPARRGVGVSVETLGKHPDTNVDIEGAVLPDFDEAKAIIEKAAQIYPNLHIQSWDVALTDQGPSLLEVNPGGNFNILQLAGGAGAFDPEFRRFLEWCVNVNPGAKANPKAFKEAKKLLKLG